MGSDFMQNFMAGWKMGESRTNSQMQRQELEMERARQQQMLQQRSEEFEFQKEEFAVRKKQLAAEEAATKLKAAHEARKLREEASYLQGMPQPTAAEVGVPQQGPEFGGPMVSEINVPQPMQAMPDPTGGADIQMPVLTGRQQMEMEQAEKQKKIREALGLLDAQEGIKAQYREKPKGLDEIFAEAKARAAGGRAGAPVQTGSSGPKPATLSGSLSFGKALEMDLKDYKVQREGAKKLMQFSKNPSGFGDLALIFAFMKTLDPASVVRESEFQTAAETGSLGEKAKAYWQQIKDGKRLSPAQRADLVNTGVSYYQESVLPTVKDVTSRYQQQAEGYDLDFGRYFNEKEWALPSGGSGQPGAPGQPRRRKYNPATGRVE